MPVLGAICSLPNHLMADPGLEMAGNWRRKSIVITAKNATRFREYKSVGEDGTTMMPPRFDPRMCRRRFLHFLAASPLFAATPALAQVPGSLPPDPVPWAPRSTATLIGSPDEALSVFDFEPVMRKNVPPAHFGYMATGLDSEATLRADREAFGKFQLRPRRLVLSGDTTYGQHDDRCACRLGAPYQRFADLPALRRIELKPHRAATRGDRFLD